MTYDLIIRNGTIVDGSGLPRYRADVGIAQGRVAAIGKLAEPARETLDAEGHIVAPGFVDAHTHMDAQVFWDKLGTCSIWHGVTSVVMGNCGFTLAPCAEKDKELVLRNFERAEDISSSAMEAGIKWAWETFPQFLDAIEPLQKGINYASYVGHSALRTYAMGERAFTQEASEADLAIMKRELSMALRAGAAGLSTTRSGNHALPNGDPVASRLASWDEVRHLVGVMRDEGAGVFEISREDIKGDEAGARDYFRRLKTLAIETKVPFTFSGNYYKEAPDEYREFYNAADEITAAGGQCAIQHTSRAAARLLSFESDMPYDKAPGWRELRARPLAEQEAALRDPETRRKLIASFKEYVKNPHEAIGADARPRVKYDQMWIMDRPTPPFRSVGEVARERNQDPLEVVIDLALEKHLKLFFQQRGFNDSEEMVVSALQHPRSVMTFTDAGAHVSQLMEASMQTYLLSYLVRERQALPLEQAIRKITYDIASFWGLKGRGWLRQGAAADIVVFNPDTVALRMPTLEYDLPAGEPRLVQKADGYAATIVNGQIVLRNGEHTGAYPGQVLRGPLAGKSQRAAA